MDRRTESRAAKAERLIKAGRVVVLADHLFGVEGDHGTYLVAIVPEERVGPVMGTTGTAVPRWSCTCPHGRDPEGVPCSHVRAGMFLVRQAQPVPDDPFAGLTSQAP